MKFYAFYHYQHISTSMSDSFGEEGVSFSLGIHQSRLCFSSLGTLTFCLELKMCSKNICPILMPRMTAMQTQPLMDMTKNITNSLIKQLRTKKIVRLPLPWFLTLSLMKGKPEEMKATTKLSNTPIDNWKYVLLVHLC